MTSINLKKGSGAIFTDADILSVKQMADRKMQVKLETNMSIKNIGFMGSSFEKEEMSIGSELAFCRMLGFPDPVERDVVNNLYYDFEINSKTIDVKASKHMYPGAFVSYEKAQKKHADLFVLIRQKTIREYIFQGVATADELICAENFKKPYGFHFNVYYLENDKLKDLIL